MIYSNDLILFENVVNGHTFNNCTITSNCNIIDCRLHKCAVSADLSNCVLEECMSDGRLTAVDCSISDCSLFRFKGQRNDIRKTKIRMIEPNIREMNIFYECEIDIMPIAMNILLDCNVNEYRFHKAKLAIEI